MRQFRLSALTVAIALLLGLPSLAAEEFAYVGSKNCKKCHFKQFKSWEATKMAEAFELLRPGVRAEAKLAAGVDPDADHTKDPQCLACHTTGYGRKGGFVDEASTPHLAQVGCEMCHGPGGTYLEPEHMSLKNKNYKRAELLKVGLIYPVGEAQCAACHNEENPFHKPFDFSTRKDEGVHEHFPLKYEHD